jgi:sulfur carrier protein ThiS
MRKVTSSEGAVKVLIGRFNEDPAEVTLDEDGTLQDALEALDISLSPTESAWVNGQEASSDDILEDGDRVIIVGKKEGGRF